MKLNQKLASALIRMAIFDLDSKNPLIAKASRLWFLGEFEYGISYADCNSLLPSLPEGEQLLEMVLAKREISQRMRTIFRETDSGNSKHTKSNVFVPLTFCPRSGRAITL